MISVKVVLRNVFNNYAHFTHSSIVFVTEAVTQKLVDEIFSLPSDLNCIECYTKSVTFKAIESFLRCGINRKIQGP